MIIALLISLIVVLQPADVPFLPADQFSYELDYSFKSKPAPSKDHVELGTYQTRHDATPLPYVKMTFEVILDVNDYAKYKLADNKSTSAKTKKIKSAKEIINLDLGYAEDIKERVQADTYYIYFIGHDKEVKHRIAIAFDKDGNMLINNEKRGKI